MTGFTPFPAHDAYSCRSPQSGAWHFPSHSGATLRAAAPFGSREGTGIAWPIRLGELPWRIPSDPTGRGAISVFLLFAAIALMCPPARAQEVAAQTRSDRDAKRDILVTGQRPAPGCTGQSAAQPVDYACLNGELKAAATSVPPPAPSAADAVTAQATTPSKVGTFSHTATAQRMGQNFGKSAQPYRPPAPQYTNPVRGAPPR